MNKRTKRISNHQRTMRFRNYNFITFVTWRRQSISKRRYTRENQSNPREGLLKQCSCHRILPGSTSAVTTDQNKQIDSKSLKWRVGGTEETIIPILSTIIWNGRTTECLLKLLSGVWISLSRFLIPRSGIFAKAQYLRELYLRHEAKTKNALRYALAWNSLRLVPNGIFRTCNDHVRSSNGNDIDGVECC